MHAPTHTHTHTQSHAVSAAEEIHPRFMLVQISAPTLFTAAPTSNLDAFTTVNNSVNHRIRIVKITQKILRITQRSFCNTQVTLLLRIPWIVMAASQRIEFV